MRFTKMQGAGNDFVVVDNRSGDVPVQNFPELAKRVCQRRFGVGADGLMVVELPERGGDLRMRFYNADGSEGEMCGNGARCIVRYGLERGLSHGDAVAVETASGLVTGRREADGRFTVRLPDTSVLEPYRPVTLDGVQLDCAYVELGRPGLPHAVWFEADWESMPETLLRERCHALRLYRAFPKGANVTVCGPVVEREVSVRTFERGVEDFTLACGTGCGAVTAALWARGALPGGVLRLRCPGGTLDVSLTPDGLFLTGPAVEVAEGVLS